MKKFLSLILIVMTLMTLTACAEAPVMKVASPSGAPGCSES